MLLLRSLLFHAGNGVTLVFFGFLSVPFIFFNKKAGIPIVLLWNRFTLFWLRVCCGIRYEVRGKMPTQAQPFVVVANHQSAWETIFLQLQFAPLTTVLKKELLRIPFFGWGMRLLEPIAIDRSNPVQALKQVKTDGVQRLQQGKNILIFPEGTRMPVAEMGSYTRSAADIAKQADVVLVPVAHNAGYFYENKSWIKKPGKVTVVIGEPITLGDKTTKAVMQTIQQWTQQQLDTIGP